MSSIEKKTIKIGFVGFWDGFSEKDFYITKILEKYYNVEISDNPDYIFCSCIGEFYKFLDYPQVRIMYIGENYIPDMNMIDYAIAPYPVSFKDRFYYLPQGMKFHDINSYLTDRSTGKVKFDSKKLEQKTVFANFVASHESEYNYRGDFFKELCKYKKVDSVGTYLNNTDFYVNNFDNSKNEYQKKCKFTLCFESTSHGGFYTEKLVQAFYNDTIPVYYGDPYINETFNKNSFINISDYDSWDDAIQEIIRLDNDDEAYIEMLNQPVLVNSNLPCDIEHGLESFLLNIFNQPKEDAYRRSRIYYANYYESFVKGCRKIYYSLPVKTAIKIKNKLLHR